MNGEDFMNKHTRVANLRLESNSVTLCWLYATLETSTKSEKSSLKFLSYEKGVPDWYFIKGDLNPKNLPFIQLLTYLVIDLFINKAFIKWLGVI